jgi:hypothetical protein
VHQDHIGRTPLTLVDPFGRRIHLVPGNKDMRSESASAKQAHRSRIVWQTGALTGISRRRTQAACRRWRAKWMARCTSPTRNPSSSRPSGRWN